MKKILYTMILCFITLAGFSQEQNAEKPKDVQKEENAAKADHVLTDKKNITKEKRKKPKREKNRKECSRMKS